MFWQVIQTIIVYYLLFQQSLYNSLFIFRHYHLVLDLVFILAVPGNSVQDHNVINIIVATRYYILYSEVPPPPQV